MRDRNTHDFLVRLTEFYEQFRTVGRNYNQCVKAIHTIYGEKKALAFLYKLTVETRKLEQLIIEVVRITQEMQKWYKERENKGKTGKDVASQ